VVDDLTVEGDNDDLLDSDFDDNDDVLVGLVLGDVDVFTEQIDAPVGADIAQNLDAALGR
jgi:hypothetical protein